MTPRLFALHRHADETGVSGTGVVAYGTEYPDGAVTIRWLGPNPSTVVWDNLDAAVRVHGHNGATQVVWLDPSTEAGRLRRWLVTIYELHSIHDDRCTDLGDCENAGTCQVCGCLWPCRTRRKAHSALDGDAS